MAAVKKRISFDNHERISKNYKLIKDNLDPNSILDHMIERQLISLDDALEIRAEKTRRRMVDALVEMLLLVGDRYNVFHDILRECGYGYMADILEGTDLQSTSNSVVEHDESLEKSNNTVLTSNRTDNTLYQNTSRTQVDEIVSDGVGSSTNKNYSPSYESDDNYLDIIHSEHMEPRWSENPEKNRIGLSTNDKQGCMAGDQPFTYDGQKVKNLPDEVTYVNDDIGTNRNSLTKHKGNSSKITKETNIPSVLALQNDGPDFQIDSNHYESVVKPCSPDHFYQCIKPDLPTTQPVYYNIDATSTSPVYERYSDDETNPHKEKQLQFASGSEENACSSIPVPKDDATGEHSSDGESYYDVANTNSVNQTCPVEPQSIKPTTKTTEMSVPPPTANILLKEPVMSGKRRNASHSNEEIDVPYQRELAHFPGWDESMNDREIKGFAAINITKQGQYVIWYSEKKSTIIVTVRNPNPGKNCLFYKVKVDRVAGEMYYRFGEKDGFRAESVPEVLEHVIRNGLPATEKGTRKSYKV